MTDIQIDNLMTSYSTSLGHFARTFPMPKKHSINLWKPVAVTALGAVVIAAFVMTPRKAVAAPPVDLMIAAFKNVKYWQTNLYRVGPNGKLVLQRSKSFYNGKMVEDFQGNLFYYFGGYGYDDYQGMPFIQKEKLNKPEVYDRLNDPMNAAFSDTLAKKESLVRQDAPNYKGQKVFALVGYGDRHRKTIEILVNESTNLPLHVMRISEMTPGKLATFISEFTYEEPKDKSIFSPNPKKEIIERKPERKALAAKWSQIPSSSDAPTVLESTISADGSIWIVTDMKQIGKDGWLPHSVVGAAYADATDEAFSLERQIFFPKVKGNQVLFAQLIPMNDNFRPGSNVEIEFVRKGSNQTKRVAVNLEPQPWAFPRSLAVFAGYVPIIPHDFAKTFAKSMYCFEHKDLKQAVIYLDRCMDIQDHNNYFQYEWVYRYAAKCYAAAGNKARSEIYRKKADKMK